MAKSVLANACRPAAHARLVTAPTAARPASAAATAARGSNCRACRTTDQQHAAGYCLPHRSSGRWRAATSRAPTSSTPTAGRSTTGSPTAGSFSPTSPPPTRCGRRRLGRTARPGRRIMMFPRRPAVHPGARIVRSMTDQASPALSRDGHDVASVVTLRPGAPDSASSLWIGAIGGGAVQGADGRSSMSRPTWALDEAVWVVVDGNNVVRVIQEAASGQPARIPVDLTAVTARFPGVIDELQLSRDGTRAAMVIDGQLTLASVEQTAGGEFALTYPRRLATGWARRWCRCRGAPVTTWWSPATTRQPGGPTSTSTAWNSDGPGGICRRPSASQRPTVGGLHSRRARGHAALGIRRRGMTRAGPTCGPSSPPAPCRCCPAEPIADRFPFSLSCRIICSSGG